MVDKRLKNIIKKYFTLIGLRGNDVENIDIHCSNRFVEHTNTMSFIINIKVSSTIHVLKYVQISVITDISQTKTFTHT